MIAPVPVLLHSPLVGPATWRAVATHLAEAGHPSVVPDLSGALDAGPPLHRAVVDRAVHGLRAAGATLPLVLVGHSGAGPLLPRIARAVRRPVVGVVYVDSVLPHPGEPWTANAPPPLVDHLRGLARDGRLPPWHEWFPPEAISEILPDPATRAAFVEELPRVPFAYLTEPASADVEHVDHHLAMLTDPTAVATALLGLISRVASRPTSG